MSVVNAHLIGRMGNAMFQYAFARKYAELNGLELRTNAWPGQEIFEGVTEGPLCDEGERLPENYRQTQADLIYTRADCRRWFRPKAQWLDWMLRSGYQTSVPLAHRRVGDYASCGYVVVSKESYERQARKLMMPIFCWITEERSTPADGLPYPFLADFLRLMYAPVILRGNSTFSWWAATLSNARVFAPVIDGLEGGKEQDVEFIESNAPKFANLECCTDLNLKEA